MSPLSQATLYRCPTCAAVAVFQASPLASATCWCLVCHGAMRSCPNEELVLTVESEWGWLTAEQVAERVEAERALCRLASEEKVATLERAHSEVVSDWMVRLDQLREHYATIRRRNSRLLRFGGLLLSTIRRRMVAMLPVIDGAERALARIDDDSADVDALLLELGGEA